MNKKNTYSSIDNNNSSSKNKNNFNTINKVKTPNNYLMKLSKQRINTTRERPVYIKANNFTYRGTKPSSLTIYNRSNNNNKKTDKPNTIKRKISQNSGNLLINLSDYNSINSFSNPNIDNLSVLFSSRLHREKEDLLFFLYPFFFYYFHFHLYYLFFLYHLLFYFSLILQFFFPKILFSYLSTILFISLFDFSFIFFHQKVFLIHLIFKFS